MVRCYTVYFYRAGESHCEINVRIFVYFSAFATKALVLRLKILLSKISKIAFECEFLFDHKKETVN